MIARALNTSAIADHFVQSIVFILLLERQLRVDKSPTDYTSRTAGM
jgi:hypothetical protein